MFSSLRLSILFIAKALLLLLVAITTGQVIARYLFSIGSVGWQELEWHVFGALFLLGIPYTFYRNEHVRVDIAYDRLSPKGKNIIDLFGTLLFLIPMSILLIWTGYEYAHKAYHLNTFYSTESTQGSSVPEKISNFLLKGERSGVPGGLPARWIIKSIIPLSFLLLLIEALRHTKKIIGRIKKRL
jgi:TRAP-type mannitol/chloroaromatic compound transport system permease small subunit